MTLGPPDSTLLHQFLTTRPDQFSVLVPAVTLLLGIGLSELFHWLRRDVEARREWQRFIERSWWEKKAAAYSTLMDHMAKMTTAFVIAQSEIKGPNPGDAGERFFSTSMKATLEITELLTKDSFLVSDAVRIRLMAMASEFTTFNKLEVMESLSACARAIQQCSADVAKLAHDDLGVPERLRGRQRRGTTA
jgi:hypothetical protein